MTDVTTLVLGLSVSHFWVVVFLVLHPMESISLNSFVLLGRLAVLLASALAVGCWLGDFLNKAIGVINFAKHFQNFMDDAVVWFLNSRLGLGLSCARDFRGLISMVTWCIG